MGVVQRKKGVVKLVHAGGIVEVHRRPIYVHQVMKKNPRHCITRPDFFEYPWIVVSPDSLLKLGSVYYIVPNHTVYNLLQSHCRTQQKAAPNSCLSHGQEERPQIDCCERASARGHGSAPRPCLRLGQEENRPQIDGFERAAAAAARGNNAAPRPCSRHGQEEKRPQIDGFERAAAARRNDEAPRPCLRHGDGPEEKMIRKVRFRLPEGDAETKINCNDEKVQMWLLDQRSQSPTITKRIL